MRLKIQVLTALAMSVAACLLYLAAQRFVTGSLPTHGPFKGVNRWWLLLLLIPALAAGFFVYRHTPRQRKTQALITVLLTLVLSTGAVTILGRML